ncbi:DNA-binding HxlR family transcriptional regulator [Bradyrhizobium sp. AZCC 1577]|uniref:winged helix-turn-helix transcriptional regulator n=1 Tax=Bradyrhizobium sp. AZCC 1577 TaxID=3117019 RepID=UPI002FEF1283
MIERHCSVRKTVEIVLDSWTFLIIREAFFGVHSFDKLQRRLGVPRQTLSTRLTALVENGILRQTRDGERATGYHFTEQGKDLFASMLSLMEFGDKWLTRGQPAPLSLTHATCGHACHPTTVCSECLEPINAWDVAYRDGPGAGYSDYEIKFKSRRSSDPTLLERVRPCSVARTLQIIGDRWSFLMMREAWFGVRRFDEMTEKLGIAPNILADRLTRLVDTGIFRKSAYRKGGDRFDYRFTKMGHDLYRPMVVMMGWGDRWLADAKPPLRLRHRRCKSDFEALVVCSHCSEPIAANDSTYTTNYEIDGLTEGPGARGFTGEVVGARSGLGES